MAVGRFWVEGKRRGDGWGGGTVREGRREKTMENEGQVGGENTGKGVDAYVTHRRTLGVAVPRRGRKDENWNADEIRRTRKTSNWVRLLGHSVVKGINSTVKLYSAVMCASEDGGNWKPRGVS